VLALLRAGRPAPGRAPPRAIDYFLRLNLFKAHAARRAFAGGSTTGSCSGVRSTFLAVHLITQSVCVMLVNRATYSLSEMPNTLSATDNLYYERLDCGANWHPIGSTLPV
jgi:hypothetical protein